MSDIETIEKDGVTYEVVDGPFVDDWGMRYWLVTEPDGTDQLVWEEDGEHADVVPHVDGEGRLVPGLKAPRSFWQTVTEWWQNP